VKTLDSFLKDRIELVVDGKAVLHLLFQNDSSLGVKSDVDSIAPEDEFKFPRQAVFLRR
jgi:hypothetical protein